MPPETQETDVHKNRLQRLQEVLDRGALKHAGKLLNALQPAFGKVR